MPARAVSSIQIPRDRRAFRRAQEPSERLWLTSGLEEANGKHLSQHGWCQMTILKTSSPAEPMKKLREPIPGQLCSLLREEQRVRHLMLSRAPPILFQARQALFHQWTFLFRQKELVLCLLGRRPQAGVRRT